MFVRAGAVIPMKTMADVTSPSPHLEWSVFAPQPHGGVGYAYEDDGDTVAFRRGAGGAGGAGGGSSVVVRTEYGGSWPEEAQGTGKVGSRSAWVNISSAGTYAGIPSARSHTIRLRGVRVLPHRVTVNGAALEAAATEAAATATPMAAAQYHLFRTVTLTTVDIVLHHFFARFPTRAVSCTLLSKHADRGLGLQSDVVPDLGLQVRPRSRWSTAATRCCFISASIPSRLRCTWSSTSSPYNLIKKHPKNTQKIDRQYNT